MKRIWEFIKWSCTAHPELFSSDAALSGTMMLDPTQASVLSAARESAVAIRENDATGTTGT